MKGINNLQGGISLSFFSRFITFLSVYTLIPLLLVFTIHYLDRYVDEIEKAEGILSLESIMIWIISYYVMGMLNIVFFSRGEKRTSFFVIWMLGQMLIGLGFVFYAFYETLTSPGNGFIIFNWDFGILYFTFLYSLIYSLVFFLIAHAIIRKRKKRVLTEENTEHP